MRIPDGGGLVTILFAIFLLLAILYLVGVRVDINS